MVLLIEDVALLIVVVAVAMRMLFACGRLES
jgi:hypothetical protein